MDSLFAKLERTITKKGKLVTEQSLLVPYLRGTEGLNHFVEQQRNLLAVVKVSDVTLVYDLVELANQLAANDEESYVLYPICSGRNWGYNTSQPAAQITNAIIIDLSNLTKICLDEDLGLLTIEPGVTQQQLSDFLIKQGDNYMVPVTGAGPDCAIVSNALERGYGITPCQDHFSAVTALKGIWGSGKRFCSAINELDGSSKELIDKTYKWGLGPYLDGLFTQSNYGIVTEMSLRLAYRRKGFISFFVQIKHDDELEKVVPIIQQTLRDYEGIVGSINLMDKRRVISMFAENPNGKENHITMSDQDVANAAQNLDTPAWTVVGSIYGTEAIAKVAKKEIKSLFSQLDCKMIFSDSLIIKLGEKVLNNLPNLAFRFSQKLSVAKEQIDSFAKGKEIMLGKPNRVALKLAYWRNPNTPSDTNLSPAKDGCGLLWYAPLVTMKPKVMRQYVDFIRSTCPKYNIEPFITFTNLRHDCIDSTIPIVFDLSNQQAVEDAHSCLKELTTEGLKHGFVSYRLNIDQQQWLLDGNSDYWQVVNQLKSVLDPNSIISEGRYNPKL